VTRIVTAYECGAVVNPDTVTGQIEGGTIMALGGALFERVMLDHGRLMSTSLASYLVPRFSDVPNIDVVLVNRPDIPSAGAGETPVIAVAPAVANAIFAATSGGCGRSPSSPAAACQAQSERHGGTPGRRTRRPPGSRAQLASAMASVNWLL
jgi:CO/xanthine dehydrogenase Mo-binding subunit